MPENELYATTCGYCGPTERATLADVARWGGCGWGLRPHNTIQYNTILCITHTAQCSRQPAGRTSTASLTAHPRHTQSHTLGHWTPHSEHAQGSLRADHTTEERGREEDAHTQRARDAWRRRSCGIRHCHIGRCMHHTAGALKPAAIKQQECHQSVIKQQSQCRSSSSRPWCL